MTGSDARKYLLKSLQRRKDIYVEYAELALLNSCRFSVGSHFWRDLQEKYSKKALELSVVIDREELNERTAGSY